MPWHQCLGCGSDTSKTDGRCVNQHCPKIRNERANQAPTKQANFGSNHKGTAHLPLKKRAIASTSSGGWCANASEHIIDYSQAQDDHFFTKTCDQTDNARPSSSSTVMGQPLDFSMWKRSIEELQPTHREQISLNPTGHQCSGTSANIPIATSTLKSGPQPGTSSSSRAPDAGTRKYDDATGYCMMCEMDFTNIYKHRDSRHRKIESLDRNYFSLDKRFYNIRILIYEGTDITELVKCTNCERPFFRYRFDNHECSFDGSKGPKIECIGPQSTANGAGYCLMCKDYFYNLDAHRHVYHLGNDRYDKRVVWGQMVLLPKETDHENDLFKCSKCLRVMYISEYFNHLEAK